MRKWTLSPIILALLATVTLVYPAYAADATPSGTIQEKLKALETEIASRAATLKLAVNQELQNKVFTGTVIAKTDSQLTISPEYPDPDNPQNEIVLVNNFTTYSTSSKKLSPAIGNGDFIIALGDVDDKGNLAAKKVIKSTPPDDPSFQSASGKVTSVDGLNITVEGKDNQSQKVATDWNTNFYSGSAEIALSNIKTDKFVVAIGSEKDGVLNARFVYLMPEELATPSPTASESASPSSSR